MDYPWAVPGAKVVCVDDSSQQGTIWWDGEALRSGDVYTIRRVWVDPEGSTVLDFEEQRRSPLACYAIGWDAGYDVRRFRPLQTRTQEQDIALFRRIADAAPADMVEA